MALRKAVFIACVASAALLSQTGCSSLSTVRLQPEAVEVGPGQIPVAAIQANAISAYLFFIPIPGVDLDKVVNQMLVATAKVMGADKIAQLRVDITPGTGFWRIRQILGWRSAQASGIAVQISNTAPDPGADDGPEPPDSRPPAAPDGASPSAPAPGGPAGGDGAAR